MANAKNREGLASQGTLRAAIGFATQRDAAALGIDCDIGANNVAGIPHVGLQLSRDPTAGDFLLSLTPRGVGMLCIICVAFSDMHDARICGS